MRIHSVLFPLAAAALLAASPALARVTFKGGKGTSYKDAVLVVAPNEMEGVAAEYQYLRANYPGWRWKTQSLDTSRKRPYDIIDICKFFTCKVIYFDISPYFGKFK